MFLKKKKMPIPETLNDCLLLWQMGYEIICKDGKVSEIKKKRKDIKKMNNTKFLASLLLEMRIEAAEGNEKTGYQIMSECTKLMTNVTDVLCECASPDNIRYSTAEKLNEVLEFVKSINRDIDQFSTKVVVRNER